MSSKTRPEIYIEIGEKIREYRLKNNLTQKELAEELDLTEKYVSRIENGKGGVKIETLTKAMNLLGMSPDIVFSELIENEDIKQKLLNLLCEGELDILISYFVKMENQADIGKRYCLSQTMISRKIESIVASLRAKYLEMINID